MIYAGKQMTATVSGMRIKPVVCEKCRTSFCYELSRVGVGKASAPYFMFQGAAAHRAEDRAGRELQKRLDREVELVPCPKCNWVNEDAVAVYRKHLYRGGTLLAYGLLGLSVLLGPIIAAGIDEATNHRHGFPFVVIPIAVVIGLLLAGLTLAMRNRLRRRIDPNFMHPRPPRLPPGTPPALVQETDARAGTIALRPVLRPGDNDLTSTDSVLLRPGQLVFPQQCCLCMEPARTIYSSPLKVDANSTLAIPLCGACSRRLLLKWWGIALIVTLVATFVAGVIALAIPGDAFGRWFVFGIVALFGTLIGAAILPNAMCRPYRLSVVDRDRGIIRFSAKNPLFTGMVAALARQSEVPPPNKMRAPPPRRAPELDRSPIPLD